MKLFFMGVVTAGLWGLFMYLGFHDLVMEVLAIGMAWSIATVALIAMTIVMVVALWLGGGKGNVLVFGDNNTFTWGSSTPSQPTLTRDGKSVNMLGKPKGDDYNV